MRVAVVSDIHANLHALGGGPRGDRRAAPDEVWCLGDLVGYGPRPNECCALVADARRRLPRGQPRPRGARHDRLDEFNGDAGAAAALDAATCWTPRRGRTSTASSPRARAHGVALFHGSPRDPVWDYVLSERRRVGHARARPTRRSSSSGTATSRCGSAQPTTRSPAGSRRRHRARAGRARWLLNPGSVGQPRDGDPRAAYLLLDLDAGRELPARRVRRRADAARDARRGLPEMLAARLELGL